MPKKLEATYPGEHALAIDRRRHAHIALELRGKNEAAIRSIRSTVGVIEAGVARNALNGIAPFVAKRRHRRGQP